MSKRPDQKRRRTCADRMRRDLAQLQRRRGKNPATSVFLQLLGILSAAMALLPPVPELSIVRRSHFRRLQPMTAPDEELGPTAYAMERGIDRVWYPRTSRIAPSWSRLVKNLSRRSTATEARELIENWVPPEAVKWLRSRIELEEWSALKALAPPGSSNEEIAVQALTEALKWEADKPQPPTSGGTGNDGQEGRDHDEPGGGPKP